MRGCAAAVIALCLLAGGVPAQGAEPFRFGLNDLPESHADSARALSLHVRLGATVQRMGLPWRSVEPQPGRLDWGVPDRRYQAALRHGMRPIFVVSSTPRWAATGNYIRQCFLNEDGQFCQRPPAPDHLDDFGSFLAAAARRYPDLAAIEIFNEPNLGNYTWQPGADPEAYAQALRAAHDAVTTVRPRVPVISGGLTGTPWPPLPGMMRPEEFLERVYAAGGRGAMDGVSVHLYPGYKAPTDPTNAADKLLGAARAISDRYGDSDIPIWVTETGYSTAPEGVSLERQAEWLPVLVRRLLRERDVAGVVVNTLADRDGEHWGIVTNDLTLKQVFPRLVSTIDRIVTERSAAACRCSRKARRCARTHSRTKSCLRKRRRCRCIRRWRRCVKRGSESRKCKRAERCAKCKRVTASGACAPLPLLRAGASPQ